MQREIERRDHASRMKAKAKKEKVQYTIYQFFSKLHILVFLLASSRENIKQKAIVIMQRCSAMLSIIQSS